MEKLVRVIKLRPGEVVVIMAEDKPTPGPFCSACMLPEKHKKDVPTFDGIVICLDDVA